MKKRKINISRFQKSYLTRKINKKNLKNNKEKKIRNINFKMIMNTN